MKHFKRPSWDEYFMEIAEVTKSRSNCIRMNVGVVIVRDKRIVTTGYNGTPMGVKNCFEGGCKRCMDRHNNLIRAGENKEKCVCIHGEQNAILQSAYHGVSTRGATMYSTVMPCTSCAKMILNCGIVRVVYKEKYTDNDGGNLLKETGVETVAFAEIKTEG